MATRSALIPLLVGVLSSCGGAQESPTASVSATTPSDSASIPSASADPVPASAEPTPKASAAAERAGAMVRVVANGVRMRVEPSTGAQLIVALPAGATVSRTDADAVDAEDLTWYEVRVGNETGWVAAGPDGDWLASVANGRIGFACTACGQDGSRAAATVEADGTDRQVLLSASGAPTWSPDGSQVVIEHEEPGSFDRSLTLMAADGSDATPLGPGWDPAWSPDGERLAFSNPSAGTLVLIDPDNRRFDLTVNDRGAPSSLSWSPDSSMLAFVAIDCEECPVDQPIMGDVGTGIYLFTPPMGAVDLIVSRGYYGQLTWSADGSSLTYFTTDLSAGGSKVRRLDLAEGTTTTLLSDSSLLSGWELSPDGTRIAAMSEEGIVLAGVDGEDRQLIVPRTDDMNPTPVHPRWSPDGRWLLYDMMWVTGDAIETWIVRADGSGDPQQVSEDAYEASWQPVLVPLDD